MTANAHSLTALFLRLREGDRDLSGSLLRRLQERLRHQLVCCASTRVLRRNPADLEDVLQNTLLRLWKLRYHFDPTRGSVEGWAWPIARNLAVDALRRRNREAAGLLRLAEQTPEPEEERESGLLAEEIQRLVAEEMERVDNPRVRQVLELRLVDGLPYEEVSRTTGVRPGTVATWVHRFRGSLRTALRQAA